MRSTGVAPHPPHIVWDWNGTLLDDNHAVLAGVNSVCAEFGREPITLEQWKSIFRRPLTACYEELLARSLSTQDWAVLDRRYHEQYNVLLREWLASAVSAAASAGPRASAVALAAGVPDALRHWRDRGGRQSLLSMWFHHELVPVVAELGMSDLFARVDGLRERTGGGSKARHLVAHLQAQAVDPAEVVVIGDVTDDADAAAAAGARCVLVSTGMMTHSALAGAGVPVVASVAEALDMIA